MDLKPAEVIAAVKVQAGAPWQVQLLLAVTNSPKLQQQNMASELASTQTLEAWLLLD